jgi:hypothetical protein
MSPMLTLLPGRKFAGGDMFNLECYDRGHPFSRAPSLWSVPVNAGPKFFDRKGHPNKHLNTEFLNLCS